MELTINSIDYITSTGEISL